MIIYIKSKKKIYNKLKYTKTKPHQPKVEFLRTHISINLQQRCKKNNLPKYEKKKKIKREREREREREITFRVGKICIKWEKEL